MGNIISLSSMIIGPVEIQLILPFSVHFVYGARLRNSIPLDSTKIKTFLTRIFLTITTKMNLLFSRAFHLFFIDCRCDCKEIAKQERTALSGSYWFVLILSKNTSKKQKPSKCKIETQDFWLLESTPLLP